MCKQARMNQLAQGQGLVEFALVLPVFLLFLLGILEFGRVFVQYFGLVYITDNVAQAAARLGGHHDTLKVVIRNSQLPLLDVSQIQVEVNTMTTDGDIVCRSGECQCQYGQIAAVSVSYPAAIRIMGMQQDLPLRVTESLFCWRGGAP